MREWSPSASGYASSVLGDAGFVPDDVNGQMEGSGR